MRTEIPAESRNVTPLQSSVSDPGKPCRALSKSGATYESISPSTCTRPSATDIAN